MIRTRSFGWVASCLLPALALFTFFPEPSFKDIVFFIAAAITMMLGSIGLVFGCMSCWVRNLH